MDEEDQAGGGYTDEDIRGRTLMGRFARPEEIAQRWRFSPISLTYPGRFVPARFSALRFFSARLLIVSPERIHGPI
jgi:hypothetical protein